MREKKEINIKVGNEIRIAREKAGLTQEQFGEMVGLGTKNVSDIERGVAGITIATLKRICERRLFQAILFYLEIRQQMMLSIFLKDWNGYHLKNLLLF